MGGRASSAGKWASSSASAAAAVPMPWASSPDSGTGQGQTWAEHGPHAPQGLLLSGPEVAASLSCSQERRWCVPLYWAPHNQHG